MKQKGKKKSVIPVYAVAVIWVIGAFGLKLTGFVGCGIVAVLSVVVFVLFSKLFPAKKQEQEQTTQTPKQEEQFSEDPEIAALEKERNRAVSEMRRLNDNIEDVTISRQINHIELTTKKIFDCVISRPEKKNELRTFLNYYLPTTIKLLNEYDRLDNLGVSGTNIDASKRKIEGLLENVCEAFDKQLDSLFSDVVMDVTAEVKVMEQMMNQGLF